MLLRRLKVQCLFGDSAELISHLQLIGVFASLYLSLLIPRQKSLGLKCNEQILECMVGAKFLRGLALIHLLHRCLLSRAKE